MTSIAVDLLAVSLLAVCLWGVKPAAPFSRAIHEDYLSPASGKCTKGLLAVVVVFHHLAQATGGAVVFPIFAKLGYLAVSVFFFFSGYGLMKQYLTRENYGRQFLLRRLPPVLVPYLIATVLYWLLYKLVGTPWSWRDILQGLWKGRPIVVASWYILCILLFYIAFRVLMLLCGKHHGWMIVGGILYCGLYVLFCVKMKYGSWWYNTVPVLIFGMVWALQEQKINAFFRKRYWIAAPAAAILFVAVYGVKIFLNSRVHGRLVSVPMTWLTAVLFACCVVLLLMKVKVRGPVLDWLGEHSLEIYLSHYLFMTLFYSRCIVVENDFLYIALVIVCTLAFAWGFHRVNRRVLKAYSGVLKAVS